MSRKKPKELSLRSLYDRRHSFLVGAISAFLILAGMAILCGGGCLLFSPLPLLFWVRTRSEDDFFIASAVGALLTFFLGSGQHALSFLALSFLPALMVHLAQAMPPKVPAGYKRAMAATLGVRIIHLWIGLVCLLAGIIFYVQPSIDSFLHVLPAISSDQRGAVIAFWAYVPFILASVWFGVLWCHLFVIVPLVSKYFGQSLTSLSLSKWSVSPIFYVLTLSIFCLSALDMGSWRILCVNISLALCLVFLVDGFLTLHMIFGQRRLGIIFYVVLVILLVSLLPLALVVFLGMIEPVVELRKLLKGEKRG